MRNIGSNWDRYHTNLAQRDEIPSNPRIVKAILSLGSVKNRKIIEVGSGMGRDSICLSKFGADVTLLDNIEKPLNQAKVLAEKHNTNIKIIVGDVFDLNGIADKYDIVFSAGLLEHFNDPVRILNEKKKICKPGGFVISDVPQTCHIYTLIKHFLMIINKWAPGWETQFTIKELEELYIKAGFVYFESYGDWSHPLLPIKIFYKLIGKKDYLGKEFKDNKFQKVIRKSRMAFYTYQHIGVIGKNSA